MLTLAYTPAYAQDLIQDDFNTLDKSTWYVTRVSGDWSYSSGLDYNAVSVKNGILHIYNDQTDNGPVVFSKPLLLDQNGDISIKRKVFIHPENDHFDGSLDIYESDDSFSSNVDKALCGVYYANETYGTPHIGFFIADGTGGLSTSLSPIWDKWLEEELRYNPKTGAATYIADGKTITYQCQSTNSEHIKVRMQSFGWYTGQYTDVDNISVSIGNTVSGSTNGLEKTSVTCKNTATGDKVSIPKAQSAWDCEAAGLTVAPGEKIQITIKGTSDH